MNTRSKTQRLLTPAKSVRVPRSDPGAPAAGGLGRSPKLDPVATVATDTPAAPISKSPETPRECSVEHSNDPLVSRSHASSSRSSATIKARRLSARAELARRSVEREQQLYEYERKLFKEIQRVEELEVEASLTAQEVDERSTRTLARDKNKAGKWRQLALEFLVQSLWNPDHVMLMGWQLPTSEREVTQLVLDMMCEVGKEPDWSLQDDVADKDIKSNNVVAESNLVHICRDLEYSTMLWLVATAVPATLQSEDWRQRHAALMAISAAAQCRHDHVAQRVDQLMSAVLCHTLFSHPRVRYAACRAVEGMAARDCNPARAAAALMAFTELCTTPVLTLYLDPLMNKLEAIFTAEFKKSPTVDQEKFLTDISQVVNILKEQCEADQRFFVNRAWTEICCILGKKFAQFLPMLMRPVMSAAASELKMALLDEDDSENIDDSSDWNFNSIGNQKKFGINVTALEEKATALQMLNCFSCECKEAFVEYAEDVVKLMVPLLSFQFNERVYTAAAESLPHLLRCARARGRQYQEGMWAYMRPELLKTITLQPEPTEILELLKSLAKCIELMGAGCLGDEAVAAVVSVVDQLLARAADGDDWDNWEEEDDDEYGLAGAGGVLAALFTAEREAFLPHLDALLPRLEPFLPFPRPGPDYQPSFWEFRDVTEYRGPACTRYGVLEPMLCGLRSPNEWVRRAAAYGCGVLAQCGGAQFADACARAVPLLAAIATEPDSRSDRKIKATENAICAVAKIIKYNHANTNRDEIIGQWLTWLPVADTTEAPLVYGLLCELAARGHAALSAPAAPPRVLALLAEAFLRGAVPADNPVHAEMVSLLRQIQGNPELFHSCLLQLSDEQKQALLALSP